MICCAKSQPKAALYEELGRAKKLMRNLSMITTTFLVILTLLASGINGKSFAVLPRSEAHRVSRLCSRYGVPKVDDGWEPAKADIEGLESRLSLISKLRTTGFLEGVRIARPASYYRQYIGIVVAEHKMIYVNAFSGDKPPSDWREKLADYCDGGPAFWGVLYDPITHEFSDLATNGIA